VVAPDDGVISARTATVGAVYPAGTELFRLVRQGRLEWRAEVPAEALRLLRPGLRATVTTLDGRRVTGTLRQLSPTADTATRNAIAYVDIPPGGGLVAGMYATGLFTLGERAALAVPESAVVVRDGNYYLMAVDAQDHVREIKVDTGRRRDEALEIIGPVDPSSRFVKSGGAFVGEGDLVQVAGDEAAAP
jgi:RND family efflux transporter MFP subunit